MSVQTTQKKYKERSSYLYIQLLCLQTIGMWPLDTNSFFLRLVYRLYTLFMIIALAWISFSQIVQVCVATNLEERSSAIDIATLTTSGLYKMVFYIVRQKDFQRLVDKMNVAFIEESADRTFKMSKWLRYAKPLTFFHISCAVFVVSVWVLCPIIDKYILDRPTPISSEMAVDKNNHMITIKELSIAFVTESHFSGRDKYYVENISNEKYNQFPLHGSENSTTFSNITSRGTSGSHLTPLAGDKNNLLKFPLNCWYPFDVTISPVYEMIYFLEVITLSASAFVYVISDTFFFAMIYVVCGQLEILKKSLKNLRLIAEETANNTLQIVDIHSLNSGSAELIIKDHSCNESENTEIVLNSELTKWIKFHSMILEFLREMEVLVCSLIVADVLHAIISLSFAMLETSISVSITDWVKMVVFVVACIWHQFLNNYFTEILTQKQLQIVDAAYNTRWEDRPESFKMNIRITVMQAYRPVIFNAYKIYYLGHTTFMEFVRAIVSYFMVLRELQAKAE